MSLSFSKKTAERVTATVATARQSFTMESVGRHCVLLPDRVADRILKITWRAVLMDGVTFGLFDVVLLLFGILRVSVRSKATEFTTFHAVSRAGMSRLRWRRFLFGFGGFFAYLLALIGVVVFLVGCVSALFLLSASASPNDRVTTATLFVTSVIFVLLGIYGGNRFESWRLPVPVRAIGRWPIKLQRMQRLPLAHSPGVS